MLADKTSVAFPATADPLKARLFYEIILGQPLKRTGPCAMDFDSNGIALGISTVSGLKPAAYSVMSWIVPDIHETNLGLQAKGVVFEKYSFFEQDADAVRLSRDGTIVAWFKDQDGNLVSLTQYKNLYSYQIS